MASSTPPGRFRNFFYFPHKGFRVLFMDLLSDIGVLDPTDFDRCKEIQRLTDEAVQIYTWHNEDESQLFGPTLKEKDPDVEKKWIAEHDDHSEELRQLSICAAEMVQEADPKKRSALADKLYDAVADYLADDLEHMAYEEKEVMTSFYKHWNDKELEAIEMNVLRQLNPGTLKLGMKWLLKGHNIEGRTALLGSIRAANPTKPEVFQDALVVAEKVLSASDYAALKQRLGV